MAFIRIVKAVVPAVLTVGAGVSVPVQAQAPNPTQRNVQQVPGGEPIYRVSVVEYAERTTKAVNYQHRSGATKIDFAGTPLLPKAKGEAKVESKQGYIEIEVEFDDLTPATQFGPEYLTYVMWAITPEGRATNLGEVLLNGHRSKLDVSTELQAFSLLVTAEPYFAVSQPSDVVVMENVIRSDTQGKVEAVDAKFELLKRGSYTKNVGTFTPVKPDKNTPLELLEADNALRLARSAGADKDARDSYQKAVDSYNQALKYNSEKNNRKPAIMSAREAIQTAEDARLIALKRQDEAHLAEQAQARQIAEADARRLAAQKAEADAAAANAKQAQVNAEEARLQASREADRLAEERAAADKARAEAVVAEHAAQRDAAQARDVAAKAEADRNALRGQLQQQLNLILETKQTARGLIVNMSDVLFDVGKATLKPEAREKLAKVAGILETHPDLKLQVEGHTDSTGSDELNQKLSENRASSARDFLVSQGIPATEITATGFGKTMPVASNDTAEGRQRNRRVELVISGAAIATGKTTSAH
jgi:outer membrane protein OmpA-like peptidoglycan-associated protein